jgi:predicted DNA-binding transcriptional regulator YafY
MKRKNIFDGESKCAQFSIIIYGLMKRREWFSNMDVMSEYLKVDKNELPTNLSKCDDYGELKKAMCILRKEINDRFKEEGDCIEERGNNRNKEFLYVGKNNDPLVDIVNAKAINDLGQYSRFCQDSAGILPKSWLEYFLKDTLDLLEMNQRKQEGKQVISSSLERNLKNIEYLPMLYEAIKQKMVLEIDYKPFSQELFTLQFHPHYLKEFNGRWFLFGHAEEKEPEWGFNIALDRIQNKPRERAKILYKSAPKSFYENYFKDIVGVSHENGASVEHVILRAHSSYIYNLIKTKPLHDSFSEVKPFDAYEDGNYAEFSVDVEKNNEFIGRVLQMGEELEVISPASFRDVFAERTRKLALLYSSKEGPNGSK